MAEVYRAVDMRLSRPVALKFLPRRVMNMPAAVERFLREARAASALNHPNIVTIYEIADSEEGRFIAMELVEGRTLRALIAEHPSLEKVAQVGAQVARALHVAHAAGIIHRDIKPENIMARDDGLVKVLDFGLARLLPAHPAHSDVETAERTAPGSLVGTARYMSPEQLRGETAASATDIFSLGLVLYELTTGRHAFAAESPMEVLSAILSQAPAAPSRFNPEIPAPLEGLILKMLEKEPRLRPSAAEVERAVVARAQPVATPRAPRRTVGREKERTELRAAFDLAAAGRGLLLCVTGEPGIGKTTLVEEFLNEMATSSRPCTIARGRCSERLAGAEAYLPFLEALGSLLRDQAEAATRLMKLVAPSWYAELAPSVAVDASAKAGSQERMKRELGAFFQELCRLEPLVLFFDDLHWADLSTVDLLAYLGTKLDSTGVLLVATYRSEEMLPARHPFLPVKLDLEGRGLCREVSLDFLTREDVDCYLDLEFPAHQLPATLPELIHAKTDGSPLFMVDLLGYLRDRRVIVQREGCWLLAQAVPELERELPASVRSMIQRKIERLGDADRRLLVAASVQGQEFDSTVVARALGMDAAQAEERLEALDRVHNFVRLVDEREFPVRVLTLHYRFVHVLYQNALYTSLTGARRASLSAAVAEALVGCYGEQSPAVATELAFLFEAARGFARAVDYFLLAAQNAAGVFAHHEVVALARRGLDVLRALPDTADRAAQELALLVTLGESLIATQGFCSSDVGDTYYRARELCRQGRGAPQLFQVLAALVTFHQVGGDPRKGKAIAAELLQLAHSRKDRVQIAGAHCEMGLASLLLGDFKSAREHLDRVRVYRPEGQVPQLIIGHDIEVVNDGFLADVLWFLGYLEQALAASSKALARAERLSHPVSRSAALWWAAHFHLLRREWERSHALIEELILLSREEGFAFWSAWTGVWRGIALAEQGKPQDGIVRMQEGLAQIRAAGIRAHYPVMLGVLAETLGKTGRLQEALSAVDEALDAAGRTRERYYEAELHRIKGELLLMQTASPEPKGTRRRAKKGKVEPKAEACFHRAIGIARRQQAKAWELRATVSLTRLYQEQGRRPEARRMLAKICGWFTEGFDTRDLKEAKALLEELS